MDNVVLIKSVYSQAVYQDGLFIEEHDRDTETDLYTCRYVINKKDIDYILQNGFYKKISEFNQPDIRNLELDSSTNDSEFVIDMVHNIQELSELIQAITKWLMNKPNFNNLNMELKHADFAIDNVKKYLRKEGKLNE